MIAVAEKYLIQQRTATGIETIAELPVLENGKVDISWLPVVGTMGSAVIESGENANGRYTKFANGMMVCESTVPLTGLNVLPDKEIWNTARYVPPAAFVGAKRVSVTSVNSVNNDTMGPSNQFIGIVASSGVLYLYNTGGTYYHVNPGEAVRNGGGYNITSASIQVVAIGRWK